MNVGERIKELRVKRGWTQTDLAKQVGITYVQVGRYEKQKAEPSSQVLQKIAAALNTTIDFLMNGSTTQQAQSSINDRELLGLFSEVDNLSEEDKHMIKFFLDAVITKRKLQSMT